MLLSTTISLSQLDQDVVDPPGDDAVVNGHLSLLVSFTNPLAAGSGLVERTPKKVRFSLWTLVVKKIFIAAGKLGTYSESSTHELSKNHIEN